MSSENVAKEKPLESKGFGIASIVLGSIALMMSWIPFLNIISVILGIIGLVFGIVAIFINLHKKMLLSIIGTVISVLSLVLFGVATGIYTSAANKAASEVSKSVSSDDSESSSDTDSSDEDSDVDLSELTEDSGPKKLGAGTTTSLTAGTWTVGKDIEPGIYVLTSPAGSGNISSEEPDDSSITDLNIILGSDPSDLDLTNYRAYLDDGEKIKIEGLNSVTFTGDKPLGNASSDQYISGQYLVGSDIKPGRYKITAVNGSGNLSTSDADVNEILSTDPDEDELSSTTVELKKGQLLTSDVAMIRLDEE